MNMLHRTLFATALIVLSAGTLRAQLVNEVKSDEGGFSAVFPIAVTPTRSSAPVETDIGTITMTVLMSTDMRSVALIAWSDYPVETLKEADRETMFDSAVSRAMANINGKVSNQSTISIDGHPGRSIYFTGRKGGTRMNGRFDYYLVQQRLFQVGYLTDNMAGVSKPKVVSFFKSFKLLKTARNTRVGEVVSSKNGKFSAQFPPGFPESTESTSQVSTEVGMLDMVTVMTSNDNAVSMIAYADYPLEAFEGTDLEVMLDSTRSGAMNSVNGVIIREKSLTINGHPGRSIFFSGVSDGRRLWGRFDYYIVEPRLFQIGYLSGNRNDFTTPEVETFFTSFKLAQRTSTQEIQK